MSAVGRRSETLPKLTSPAASEMIGMFAKHNPDLNRAQVEPIGKLVASFGATAAKLSPAARRRLGARLREIIEQAVAEPGAAVEPLKLVAREGVEASQGAGLGETLTEDEGRARLSAYATPTPVEAWAGAVAGPSQLEREFGVARSTLHTWQRQGAVIGIQVGIRKHAFPVEQFIDGRPVAGLGLVVEAIGETRTAWRWLREPNPGLAGATPLSRLKAGQVEAVVALARSNFARE